MLIHAGLALEVCTRGAALAPCALLQQNTRATCVIDLQLNQTYQIIKLSTIRSGHIVTGMYRLRSVYISCAGACKHYPIVVIQALIVVAPLIVYKLTDSARILAYGNPVVLLRTCSAILYTQYTIRRVFILRVQAPQYMAVAFCIYTSIYFRERDTHRNQISSVF